MASYYGELLKLCGFEGDEIDREKPRIDRVFQRLELVPDDVKRGERWVNENHDVELRGVRRLLRVWLMELVDLVLAKEEGKQIVYYGFPSIPAPTMAMKAAANEASAELYCANPEAILCHTIGQIFNRLTPILELAEGNGLPPGHGLCSLPQLRVGALAKGIIPIPDLATGSSYYCDVGSKTEELLCERYGYRTIYVDGSMDSKWGEYPYFPPERAELLGTQINRLLGTSKESMGVEVTNDAWDRARSDGRSLRGALDRLGQLMMADPLPISAVEVSQARALAAGTTGRALTEGAEAVSILCDEVEKRVESGIGLVEKGAPRVLLFLASFSDPTIVHMMENAGLAVTGMPVAGSAKSSSPKEHLPDAYTTIAEMRAASALRGGIYHSSFGLARRMEEAVRYSKADGFIWGYQFSCRPIAMGSHFVKQWVEEHTGVPTLSLEMDIYDSRNYNSATMRTKVEAFAEMLRARKASVKT
jgi:hypothetical protein